MTRIQEELFELKEEKYAQFQANLTPGIDIKSIIGIRIPELRKYAKKLVKDERCEEFLRELPHQYYDENILHALLLCDLKKDYDTTLEYVEAFLPYMDNWAVCDSTIPKVFEKNKEKLINKIVEWTDSEHTYTCRFGMKMLMTHFLKESYKTEYLKIPAKVISEEYYVNMMQAWFYATAMAFQYEDTVKYIEQNKLSKWVHNKTIQKSVESYRVTDEHKEYLKTLRRK